MKVRLDLGEDLPRALALRRQQTAPVLEAAPGPSRDRAEDVQVGVQRLRRGRLRPDRRGVRRVGGQTQHQQRIGQDQRTRGLGPSHVDLIELADLARGEPVRRDRLGEAHAVGRVGARQRHEVFHRGMRDELAVAHVLLNGRGERAHQPEAPRHPAHAAIEAARQGVERQAMLLMQRAQQPALLERAVGRVGVQQLPKDQRLGLRHLPDHGGHGVAMQPPEAADAFVAIHDHVGRARRHDHDRHLLTGVRQGGEEPPFAHRLPHAQPLVSPIELMKFQFHGLSVRWRLLSPLADRVLRGGRGKSAAKPNTVSHLTGLLVLRGSLGKSARFSCGIKHVGGLLVLRGPQHDSTEMPEEIGARDAEFLLGEIPRQLREGRREHQRRDAALGHTGLQPAALDAMGDEVVGITLTPRRLRPCAARGLTG